MQMLYTANCHLEGSPYKPAERVNQLRSTLASLSKHQAAAGLEPGTCHVVVAGDLNSCSSEGPYKLMAQGWLPAGYREAHLPNKVW
jgi:CCR4-NOT transcription complex subunit 6